MYYNLYLITWRMSFKSSPVGNASFKRDGANLLLLLLSTQEKVSSSTMPLNVHSISTTKREEKFQNNPYITENCIWLLKFRRMKILPRGFSSSSLASPCPKGWVENRKVLSKAIISVSLSLSMCLHGLSEFWVLK